MGIAPRQIGWSNESNLLWQISKQLEKLNGVVAATAAGGMLNPTTNYIPFNSGLAFGDSYLVNDTTASVLKTVYSLSDIGLKLDFANNSYVLGGINDGYNVRVTGFDPNGGVDIGDYNLYASGTQINLRQDFIKTQFNGNDIGLNLDFANNVYWLGNSNIQSHIVEGIVGAGNFYIYLPQVGDIQGLNVSFVDVTTGLLSGVQIGDILTAGNGTYLSISDANQSWEMSSNLSANTAGASASKYLKVRIGGIDYKIALLNNA